MMRTLTVLLVSFLCWNSSLLAQEKEEPKPAKKPVTPGRLSAQMDKAMRDAIMKQLARNALLRRIDSRVEKPHVAPTKQDRVRDALAEVERAARRAQHLTDPKAIQAELDKAEKALMKARRCLWKRVRQKGKPAAPQRRRTVRQIVILGLPGASKLIPRLQTKMRGVLSEKAVQADVAFLRKAYGLRVDVRYAAVRDGVAVIFQAVPTEASATPKPRGPTSRRNGRPQPRR